MVGIKNRIKIVRNIPGLNQDKSNPESAKEYELWWRTLLEIRVFLGVFTNINNKPLKGFLNTL
jgi:hypothetical protein